MLIRLEFNDRVIHQIKAADITGEIVIGRSSSCTWSVPKEDKLASSRHLAISLRGKHVYVKDLQSTNGSFFNGKRITERNLAEGDKIGVGNCILYALPDSGSSKNRCSELLVLSGKERNKKKKLVPPLFTIGSDPASSLVFLDMLISRNHAQIAINDDGSCWLKDLNSKNGTSVNGVPLRSEKERLLKDGDKISFSQMEVEFHDGAVARTTSHVWLKLAIIVMTAVLALGSYNLYKRWQPSAAFYIAECRKLAAEEQFDEAARMLLKAENAHHAQAQQVEILQLRRLLEIWQRTSRMWYETRDLLKSEKWTAVSRNLGQLQSEKSEAWEWNKKAGAQKDQALFCKSMLDARSRFLAMLARDSVRLDQLRELSDDAAALLQQQPADDLPEYLQPLHGELAEANLQLNELLVNVQSVEAALDKLVLDQPPFAEIEVVLEQAGKSKKRVVKNMASKMVPVVAGLAESDAVLRKVIAAVQALDTQSVRSSDLNLPSADVCALDPRASTARQSLEKKHTEIRLQGSQALLFFQAVDEIIGRAGTDIPHLAEFRSKDVMHNVLACDSLERPLPRRSRKQASGDYDRMLGVEEFYAWMDALPEPLDPAFVSDIAFRPLLTQAGELWKKIALFITFVEQPANNWMVSGELQSQLERCKSLVALRDELVHGLLEKARSSAGREALIAAGTACRMLGNNNATTFMDKPLAEWIDGEFSTYRRGLIKLNEEFSLASLEQKVTIRDKVMVVGLPGDPIVRRMWAMRDASRGK